MSPQSILSSTADELLPRNERRGDMREFVTVGVREGNLSARAEVS